MAEVLELHGPWLAGCPNVTDGYKYPELPVGKIDELVGCGYNEMQIALYVRGYREAMLEVDLPITLICARNGFATGHGDRLTDIIREMGAQIETRLTSLNDRLIEERLLANEWMQKHDKLLAGFAEDFKNRISDLSPARSPVE